MPSPRFEKKFVGAKAAPGVYHRIINLIPPHGTFIEPFAGEATIARHMLPSRRTILVDKVRQPALACAELRHAEFVQGDGIAFLDGFRYRGDEFVYADPPYVLAARAQRGRAYYPAEMPDVDQRRFLRVILGLNCRVLVSGYRSPMYDDALATWEREEFEVMTRGGKKATEVLWRNYPRPAELHDYRFVGDTFRARCRLRRQIRTAVNKLLALPALERNATFHFLSQAMRRPVAAVGLEAGADVPGARPVFMGQGSGVLG